MEGLSIGPFWRQRNYGLKNSGGKNNSDRHLLDGHSTICPWRTLVVGILFRLWKSVSQLPDWFRHRKRRRYRPSLGCEVWMGFLK